MKSISKFNKEWFSKPRIVCGLMTGTSLDGIDTAIVKFYIDESQNHCLEIIAYKTFDYPPEVRNYIFKIINDKITLADISRLHYLISQIYADCIVKLCRMNDFQISEIDAIGIHGQTVWHEPSPFNIGDYKVTSSLQLGSISYLANLLRLTVVGDFRAADLALGGNAAPLVPIFDYMFLKSLSEDVIALNIGGIANFTYLPVNADINQTLALDSGPGNVLIDSLTKLFFSFDYDKDGAIAQSGSLNYLLLSELMKIPFITQKPPKSTGRELFNLNLILSLIKKLNIEKEPKENIIRTLTQFTATSIADNIKKYANQKSKIIVSGGGSHNIFLMQLLSNELPQAKFINIDELGIIGDAKEAICFAYLAYRTLGGLKSNIKSVTGANKSAVLGTIAIPG